MMRVLRLCCAQQPVVKDPAVNPQPSFSPAGSLDDKPTVSVGSAVEVAAPHSANGRASTGPDFEASIVDVFTTPQTTPGVTPSQSAPSSAGTYPGALPAPKTVDSACNTLAAGGGSYNDRLDSAASAASDAPSSAAALVLESKLKIDFKELYFHELIGKGSFKTVYRGRWNNTNVAIVSMRRGGMVTEARVLQRMSNHPNLVQFYRWTTDDRGNEYMVIELVKLGSLDQVLLSFGNALRGRAKVMICEQICSAMCELEDEKVLHRDLAARNILVQSMDPVHIKVADFGLARSGTGPESIESVPARWCAPEVFTRGEWSQKSEVWAYGVTMWEIFANGAEPYARKNDEEVIHSVLLGERLARPAKCPRELYKLMQDCWRQNPVERPTFAQMAQLYKKWRDTFQAAKSDGQVGQGLPAVESAMDSLLRAQSASTKAGTPQLSPPHSSSPWSQQHVATPGLQHLAAAGHHGSGTGSIGLGGDKALDLQLSTQHHHQHAQHMLQSPAQQQQRQQQSGRDDVMASYPEDFHRSLSGSSSLSEMRSPSTTAADLLASPNSTAGGRSISLMGSSNAAVGTRHGSAGTVASGSVTSMRHLAGGGHGGGPRDLPPMGRAGSSGLQFTIEDTLHMSFDVEPQIEPTISFSTLQSMNFLPYPAPPAGTQLQPIMQGCVSSSSGPSTSVPPIQRGNLRLEHVASARSLHSYSGNERSSPQSVLSGGSRADSDHVGRAAAAGRFCGSSTAAGVERPCSSAPLPASTQRPLPADANQSGQTSPPDRPLRHLRSDLPSAAAYPEVTAEQRRASNAAAVRYNPYVDIQSLIRAQNTPP